MMSAQAMRIIRGSRPIRPATWRALSQRYEPGYDPYRYTGSQYAIDVYAHVMRQTQRLFARAASQVLEPGYDPYATFGSTPEITHVGGMPVAEVHARAQERRFSQLTDNGCDPYNKVNAGRRPVWRFTLDSRPHPSHNTPRKS